MSPSDVEELFDQTLRGEYEDEAPWNAVRKLQLNGDRSIFEFAAAWLQSPIPLKRARAAGVLGQLQSPRHEAVGETVMLTERIFREESYQLLVELLDIEQNEMVLDSAISALGHLKNSAAVAVIARYGQHADENVRFAVAWALGCFPDNPQAIAVLILLMKDADSEIRDWATFGLGVQGSTDTKEIRDALLERTFDADESVREEAVVGLGKRRDPRLLPILRSLLNAPELKVRVAEAASAMLGFEQDPEEWEQKDYCRALDEKFGVAGRSKPF